MRDQAIRVMDECARIAEILLRNESAVIPIASYNLECGVTLSLPSVLGRSGVVRTLEPVHVRRGA